MRASVSLREGALRERIASPEGSALRRGVSFARKRVNTSWAGEGSRPSLLEGLGATASVALREGEKRHVADIGAHPAIGLRHRRAHVQCS